MTVAGVTVIPVTKVSLNWQRCGGGMSLFGLKQPVSVVVASPSQKRAFRITGEEVPLEQLIQEVPAVKDVVQGL